MLIGMAFSATFSNMMPEERLEQIMKGFNPILGVAMIVVILNLGAPLDYHLILGAGLFTAIYIIARALGKYFGAFFGAAVTKSPKTVRNFLGFTLLPHSGVSLVFTGIAVSVLTGPAPECSENHPGYHRRRGGNQRDHRGYHGEKRIRMGGGISQRRA